jgi:class 3 adenylate cyclase
MQVTIRMKIFAVAAALLLLMVAVLIFTTRMAANVGGQLGYIVSDYIPGYAAMARAEVWSLAQGLELRRLLLAHTLAPDDKKTIEQRRTEAETAAREHDRQMALARSELGERLASPTDFDDSVALARLDELIEIMIEERQKYQSRAGQIVAALNDGNLALAGENLAALDPLRDDANRRLDVAQRRMLEITENAARAALEHQTSVINLSLAVTGIAVILGLLFAAVVSSSLVAPVRRLLKATQAVEGGSLDTTVPVTSRDEIGRLTEAFNRMVQELRVKARIRETFGKYVDPRIVQGLIERPELTAAAGERRSMTVLFCDMKGFTTLSEGLTPTGLVNIVNSYLTEMSGAIRKHNGIIDKYIGDAIMAFWGMPFNSHDQQAELACLAALEQLVRLQLFRERLPELMGIKKGVPNIDMRIGIATGEVIVGNIGSDVTKSYTVMGDTVNFASRLEGANKAYRTRILVNAQTADMVSTVLETREIDSVLVVGKTEPEQIFEVMGQRDLITDAQKSLRERYAEGLAAYRRQEWNAAQAAFEACLSIVPDDGPSKAMLKRIPVLSAHPPHPDWNGVWEMTEK